MDFLDRLLGIDEEAYDTYYETVHDLIREKINTFYKNNSKAPKYLLVGRERLHDVAKICYFILSYGRSVKSITDAENMLLQSSNNKFYGMNVLIVVNNTDMLEVV